MPTRSDTLAPTTLNKNPKATNPRPENLDPKHKPTTLNPKTPKPKNTQGSAVDEGFGCSDQKQACRAHGARGLPKRTSLSGSLNSVLFLGPQDTTAPKKKTLKRDRTLENHPFRSHGLGLGQRGDAVSVGAYGKPNKTRRQKSQVGETLHQNSTQAHKPKPYKP